MSSGSLPLGAYHRAQSIGSGSYGSVTTVYDDDGNQFALKLFDDDDDDEVGIPLGALREISILRLLRHDNAHPNIIAIHDVQTGFSDDPDVVGAGTDGCLSMAMPLFPDGSLMDAVESNRLQTKAEKIRIAHGILCAVAHLHDNSIIHRDIKSDNILLRRSDSDSYGGEKRLGVMVPVLIDFSLAKIMDPSAIVSGGNQMNPSYTTEMEQTHTPSIGTPTYRAPEVIEEEGYGFPSDLWSVGVCLLEILRGKPLEATKDKGALPLIKKCLSALPEDQPFPNLIRGLLQVDPSKRLTAPQALESMVFRKFGIEAKPQEIANLQRPRISILSALPFEHQGTGEENSGDAARQQKENRDFSSGNIDDSELGQGCNKWRKPDPVLGKRFKRIQNLCKAMEWNNPMTAQAAMTFSTQMGELCDMDDPDDTQAFLDCIILAHKFFERELTDLSDLPCTHAAFESWDIDEYADNEGTIFMFMDYCLYPRQFFEF